MLLVLNIHIIFSLTVNSCSTFSHPLLDLCALIGQLAPAWAGLPMVLLPQLCRCVWNHNICLQCGTFKARFHWDFQLWVCTGCLTVLLQLPELDNIKLSHSYKWEELVYDLQSPSDWDPISQNGLRQCVGVQGWWIVFSLAMTELIKLSCPWCWRVTLMTCPVLFQPDQFHTDCGLVWASDV